MPAKAGVSIEALKIAIPAFISLVVAIGGWVITRAYNRSQQNIAQDKNQADIEVAKVNTAIRFLELFEKIPDTEPAKQSNAIAVSVPILPPDFAFDLAVSHLDHDTGAIEALFGRYKSGSFVYLERHLARGPVFRSAEFVSDVEFDPQPGKLFDFLSSRGLDTGIEDYLFLSDVQNKSVRTNAIINYFKFLRSKSDESKNESLGFVRHFDLEKRVLQNDKINAEVKNAVALGSCMAFLNGYGDERDGPMLELAAKYFWNDLDVSSGELPREDSLQGFVYRHAFHYSNAGDSRVVALPVRDKLSKELITRIKAIKDFDQLTWDRVRLIMYTYMTYTPRDTDSPFVSFLSPDDAVELYRMILRWANTPERRLNLGREINSLSGDAMFRNVGRDQRAQRLWAELTVQFYVAYYSKDWYPAKIMPEIAAEFPDLRASMKGKEWGFSQP